MPTARSALASSEVNGIIYVIRGLNGGSVVDLVEALAPQAFSLGSPSFPAKK